MLPITIPDTDVFKEKALAVANAYDRLEMLKFAEFLHSQAPGESAGDLKDLVEVAGPTRDLMESLGYPLTGFSNETLYGIKDREVLPADREEVMKTAKKQFREAKESLYSQSTGVNGQHFPKTHRSKGHVEMYKARTEGKQKLEQILNEHVADVAYKEGLKMPIDLQYFGTEKAEEIAR